MPSVRLDGIYRQKPNGSLRMSDYPSSSLSCRGPLERYCVGILDAGYGGAGGSVELVLIADGLVDKSSCATRFETFQRHRRKWKICMNYWKCCQVIGFNGVVFLWRVLSQPGTPDGTFISCIRVENRKIESVTPTLGRWRDDPSARHV